jgi:hypothetical protein
VKEAKATPFHFGGVSLSFLHLSDIQDFPLQRLNPLLARFCVAVTCTCREEDKGGERVLFDLLRRRKRLSWWSLGWCKRSEKSAEEVRSEDAFSLLPLDNGGIPEVAEREHIQQALAQMPQEYAIVLVLSAAQGLSYLEIATILDLSPTATASRLSRAKKMFVAQYQRLSRDDLGTQEKPS